MFEITVERTFTATHALRLTDGTREPVHSHEWHLTVTVASAQLDSIDTVMDFHELERMVDGVIDPIRDRDLNAEEPFADGRMNPSAERVAQWPPIGLRIW